MFLINKKIEEVFVAEAEKNETTDSIHINSHCYRLLVTSLKLTFPHIFIYFDF